MNRVDTEEALKDLSGRKVLVAVGGGIAAYKVVDFVRRLMKRGAEVRVVMTRSATCFIHPTTFAAVTGHPVGLEMFSDEGLPGAPHLELAHWAELIVVAPATADLLAKMAAGIADDLLSTSLLAATCPVMTAPAMNETMYAHPATQANLVTLKARGVLQVGPEQGEMASPGEKPGLGRMSEPEQLIDAAVDILTSGKDLAGKKVVITAGRTEEAIDPVRVLTNRSSGRMGVALAEAARQRGAEVVLIHGPMDVAPPSGVRTIHIVTAQQLLEACEKEIPAADLVFYAAAVADWRPKVRSSEKMKREDQAPPTIELEDNPDVSALTSGLGNGIKIGFALEEDEDVESALDKLKRKGLHAILLNTFEAIGSGENRVTWIDNKGTVEQSDTGTKTTIARWIIDRVARLLNKDDNSSG